MKYNTISTSSMASEGRKASFTVYTDMDISQNKKVYTEAEMTSIRGELEIVQKALKLQTKRCRQLVAEYTRQLQEKEQQYRSEQALRDNQLAKVLRALLIFEARLRQEQKYISHQLNEKDHIIKKQSNDIKKLLSNQYCKNCNQYYASSPIQESLDSSSEYVVTDYQDYQSSNFESLDSSSETYATISEKGYNKSEDSIQENSKAESESFKCTYQKNRNKDSLGRRSKKIPHRKSIGTYFEVLKLRNDNNSPISNEDNTSNDYDNLDSLPPESVTDKASLISEQVNGTESSPNVSLSECNNTVINKTFDEDKTSQNQANEIKLSNTIPVFEADEETNDNWYASASDQEDEEHRDIYRNNPVLECMNQILLQNINDLNSPPKTPSIERKSLKNKRVKFSDQEESRPTKLENHEDYYETPIQKTPNFYETPQSIYSNDYEQILSKCNETFSSSKTDQPNNHYYVDMENKTEEKEKVIRKSKILRTPPALPPKPANLTSKYKIQTVSKKLPSESEDSVLEFEPDYCSISELNLPETKNISFKKISVVAEINAPTSLDVLSKMNPQNDETEKTKTENIESKIDVLTKINQTKQDKNSNNDTLSKILIPNDTKTTNLVVKKCVEKLNIQLAKKSELTIHLSTKKSDADIPKLPQVSEIIIPDETEDKEKEERISQDNYVKNNSQIFKLKSTPNRNRPIVVGSSVSSLISGFNNQHLFSETKKKPNKLPKQVFSSFENLQNSDKHSESFENFDLSQNFEEFKLDDCEIEEYSVEEEDSATPQLNRHSVELLKKQLEFQTKEKNNFRGTEPTYEHFLECTGLSSKSILTPSRLLSNHKSMLKPKDVKLRSKVKATTSLLDRHSTSSVKYWSEPYV